MVIVESKTQLQDFIKSYKTEDSIIILIPCDSNKHSVNTKLSLLYVQLLGGNEFILPFNHSETLNIKFPNLESDTKKYTYDIKKLNHFVKLNNVIDVNLMNYMNTGHPLDLEQTDTNAHNFLNMRYYKKQDINNVVPVMKHM